MSATSNQVRTDQIVGTKYIAEVLGISTRRVEQLVKKGLPKHARGKFFLPAVVQWYVKNRLEQISGDSDDIKDARRKLYDSQRERCDLETGRLRRELIDGSEVSIAMNEIGVIVSTMLDALGGRLAQDLAGINKPAEIQSRLFSETRAIRSDIADKLDAFAISLDDRPDHTAAA